MRRKGEPERSGAPAFGRERVLEMIRDTSETVTGPEAQPRKPAGFLRQDQIEAQEQAGSESEDLRATRRWQLWSDDVTQRNRKRIASVLWACHELRAFRDGPVFSELGAPLSLALERFGVQTVPETGHGRRELVECWRPRR